MAKSAEYKVVHFKILLYLSFPFCWSLKYSESWLKNQGTNRTVSCCFFLIPFFKKKRVLLACPSLWWVHANENDFVIWLWLMFTLQSQQFLLWVWFIHSLELHSFFYRSAPFVHGSLFVFVVYFHEWKRVWCGVPSASQSPYSNLTLCSAVLFTCIIVCRINEACIICNCCSQLESYLLFWC